MWFEADPIFPYLTTNDPLLSDPGLYPGPPAPDAWSAFPGTRAAFERDDFFGDLRFTSDWLDLGVLFTPLPTIADEWGDAPTTKDSDRVMNEGVITVTGKRIIRLDTYSWLSSGAGPDLFWSVHLDGGWDGGGGVFDPQPLDGEAIEVLINFDRPLTDSETQAIENFQAAIAALTVAINALADNAELRLPNGAYITGAALKALWAQTDFIINDNHVDYGNGGQGQAAMINGQPTISFNIGELDRYDYWFGGMNYLVAHDFAHLTQWGTPFAYDQLTANDIAREILSASGLPYLSNPVFGYGTIAPFGFSTPSGDGGGGPGGDGGGGGGGGGGDFIP